MDLATLLSLLSLLVSAISLIVAISVFRQTSILRRDDERFRWALQMQRAVLAHTKLHLVLDRAVRLDADIERFVNQADFGRLGGELAGVDRIVDRTTRFSYTATHAQRRCPSSA